MKDLFAFLDGLRDSKFFGTLEIKVESGKIVLMKKIETIKLEALPVSAVKSQHRAAYVPVVDKNGMKW